MIFLDYVQLTIENISISKHDLTALILDGFELLRENSYTNGKVLIQLSELDKPSSTWKRNKANLINKISKQNYMKIHFKGSFFEGETTKENIREFTHFLIDYNFMNYDKLFISRIDISENIYGCNFDNYKIDKKKNDRVVNKWYKGIKQNGIGYGSKFSDRYFLVYDKKLDLKKARLKAIQRFNSDFHIRQELRLKRKGLRVAGFTDLHTITPKRLKEVYYDELELYNIHFELTDENISRNNDEIKKYYDGETISYYETALKNIQFLAGTDSELLNELKTKIKNI